METARVMLVSFAVNLFLIIFKILFGVVFNSVSLIADGIHSCSDLMVDTFAIIGLKFINKKEDIKHPFGYGKLEYIISLVMGIFIITLGFTIIKGSIKQEIVIPSLFVVIISLTTLIIKIMLSNYVIKEGKKYKNNILISSGSESRSDVFSSLVVILSTILMNLSNSFKYADIIASILVGLIILNIGVKIIKDNVSNLLDKNELDCDIKEKIEKLFLDDSSILYIEDLTILKLGPYNKIIIKVFMEKDITLLEARKNIDKIKKELLNTDKIKYVIVDINPYINDGV